jgi:glycosyltransferase involved in cell wall biosynthesis
MKIFQIITLSELGGAQSVLLHLANSLAEEGHEVFVVAGGEGAMWDALDERVRRVKVSALRRDVSPRDIVVWLRLVLLGIRHKPDVVHLHSSKAGALGRLAFPRRKIIYTVHGFDSIRVAYRRFLPVEKLLKGRTRAIVAVSEYDRRNLAEEGIVRNVVTIRNGIEPIANNELRIMGEQFDPHKKTVLTIARTDPPKRYPLFEEVAHALPHYNFVWIGNRTAPPDPLPNVTLLGEIPAAGRYYAAADLCMLASDYEGLPMTIIEAMSLARPVVASDVGGVSEIVRDGENGFCVDNTHAAFAEKISLILENDSLRRRLGRRSKKIFEAELTASKMVEQYLKVYQS